MDMIILPSLLAADFGRLDEECRRVAASGADELHLDIMDAHFVPNLSFGPDVVAMARRAVPGLRRNVHLMITHPQKYAPRFIENGATTVQIHIESADDAAATLAEIRGKKVRCGLVLKPATPAESVFALLPQVDEVLVMTVEPGYGGQSFMAGMLPKIAAIRCEALRQNLPALTVMVDGGIGTETAAQCAAHGANAFVAGTSLFKLPDMAAGVAAMRKAAAAVYGKNLK